MTAALSFGSLDRVLQDTAPLILRSAGPVSDAYILSTERMCLITGPGGSGKTTASAKKALVEGQRIHPGSDRIRRYVLGVWRQKYDNLWAATIPSWWTIFPQDLPGSHWSGSKPRAAEHEIVFEDQWGAVEMTVQFRAFGESMDPEDIRGNQFTDVYLNEMSTLPEAFVERLFDRVGRLPPRSVIKRPGRIFGDDNAPDVMSWVYRDFYENQKPDHVLYEQPGGRHPNAENVEAMGREFWHENARANAHRQWWVRRMVDNIPGMTRDVNIVYESYDDTVNRSSVPLEATRMLPIVVGIDGGFTPSVVYTQVVGRQARVLAEVVLERGGMRELAEAMLELEAQRFPGCEFSDRCDPAMAAGEDLEEKSDRQRLGEYLGREVVAAPTNEVGRRVDAVKEYIGRNLGPGRPGLLIDPRCLAVRRGFNQTYHYRRTRGSNDLSSIEKTPDSHVHDGLQYAALAWGTDAATLRSSEKLRALQKRREAARDQPRRNPLARRRA